MVDPYGSFKNYIDKLENNLRLMDIQTVIFGEFVEGEIEESELGEDYIPQAINFDFSLVTYYK